MILEGHWKQNYWDGIVKQLHVKTSHLATWSLKSPTKIDANLSKLTLGMLCLISQHNQICGQVNWRKNSSSLAKLEYSLQDFQSVTDLMPSIKNIKGRVTGKILISNFTKKPIFNGYLSYLNGAVVLPDLNVKLFGMNIDGNIKNNKMTVNAMVRSGNGVMQLTGDAGLKDMALYSTINIKGHDFIMSNTKQYRVVVSPDLTVGLQQNTLNVKGNITLHDVLFAPINFSNVVTMPANEVNYIDNIEEPQATPLQINGKVNVLLDKKVKVNFKGVTGGLTGGLLLTMKPQQPIIASGQLSLINGKYSIYGQNLDIHNSQIIYHNMPIDNPNLDITAVRVIKQDQLDTLTYSNNDLTVGVTISGSVAQPKYVFFSIPAGLSQSDILSYLVLGQAFNQANSSTGQLLVSLTQALQSGNGPGVFGKVTNDIKRSFGLSELSLQTSNSQGDNGDKPFTTSSLVVGKYLLPRLYVSYGFGFLGAVNTVRMRYSLKHNWALQTESNSIGSGADILYSIER